MKALFVLITFLTVEAYSCTMVELADKAEQAISSFAKSKGANTYISGPGFLNGQQMQFPFSFHDQSNRLQIGVMYSDLPSCEVIGQGYGTASEKNVR